MNESNVFFSISFYYEWLFLESIHKLRALKITNFRSSPALQAKIYDENFKN